MELSVGRPSFGHEINCQVKHYDVITLDETCEDILWQNVIYMMVFATYLPHLFGKVCTNVEAERQLQPFDNERFNFRSAVTSTEARLDFKAGGF